MRISDWSSDVCSADLRQIDAGAGTRVDRQRPSDAQLVDLAEAFVGTRIADLPSLVAVLATDREARGDPFAERAGNMAGEIIGLIIAQFGADPGRSEEHTSELQSLMRISYAVFCLIKKNNPDTPRTFD